MNNLGIRALPIFAVTLAIATVAQTTVVKAESMPATRINDVVTSRKLDQSNRSAASLMTRPMSIERMFNQLRRPERQIQRVLGTDIPSAKSQLPQPINPVEAINNPGEALRRFFEQEPATPPPLEPLEFFQLPKRDTGVSLDVMNF